MKKFLLTYAYVCISVISLFSQINCNPIASTDPCKAPLLCGTSALDSFCGYTGLAGPNIPPIGFCSTIENNQWVSFIALTPSLTIRYNVTNCVKNLGIEVGVFAFEPCTAPAGIIGCFSPLSGPLTFAGLIPGKQYFLMTDGVAGDMCDYTIDVLSGALGSSYLTKPTVLNGTKPISVESSFSYSIPPVSGGNSYNWTVASGNATLLQTGDTTFSLTAYSPGIIKVCVDVSNNCGGSTSNCWDIPAYKIVSVYPPPIVFCKGMDTIIDPCGNLIIWGNGTPAVDFYQCTLKNYMGLDSIINVRIYRKPNFVPVKTYYLAHNEPLRVFDYVIPFNFPKGINPPRDCFLDTTLTKFHGSIDGICDSAVRALVYNIGAISKITVTNLVATNCFSPIKVLKGEVTPCFGNVTYRWFKDSVILGTNSDLNITESGTYKLIVTNTYNKPAPNPIAYISNDTSTLYVDINVAVTAGATIFPKVSSVFTNTKAFTLSGIPSGGKFSGTGVVGNKFNPSLAGAGTFFITYEGFNVCPFKGTKKIKVVGLKKKVGNLIGNNDPLFSFSNNNETETKQEIIIKPNPTSNFIEFQANFLTSESKVKVLITNILGQSVIEKEFNIENGTLESQLDVSNFENGTYLMFVFDDENIINAKFLKMK
jgi:hypothetical protein